MVQVDRLALSLSRKVLRFDVIHQNNYYVSVDFRFVSGVNETEWMFAELCIVTSGNVVALPTAATGVTHSVEGGKFSKPRFGYPALARRE